MKKLIAVSALLISIFAMSTPALPVHAQTPPYEPEMIAHAITAPTSPQTSGPAVLLPPYNLVPWGLDRIDQRGNTLDNSYSFSGNGAGVKVYVVDSGVNATHVEFGRPTSRVVDGWSYRADTTPTAGSYRNSIESYHSARTVNNIAPCASRPTTQQFDPSTFDDRVNIAGADTTDKGKTDNDGHGTHVAGTIGGEYTGVAKGVTIVPVRVLDSCGSGTTSMVHNGLKWILNDHQPGEKAVINMSIGFDASATAIDTDIRDLLAEGIVVVAAAGNDGGSSCNTTPAGTPGTISVGAVDSASKEAYYTNFGECVDIFAPGSEIISTWPKNGSLNDYTYYSETGTSMAAPHVAGVAALQLVGRTVTSSTPGEIWNWMKLNSSCDVVTYYNTSLDITAQTPNRVLNNGVAAGPACKPATVKATASNASISLTWTEPASPNGSALTGYTATLSPGGASCTTDPATLTCTISGLTNNTAYTASVRGVNAVGASVDAATVSATPVGSPLPVANLVAGVANNSLVVSWTQQPGDGTGITYVATATPGGASCSVANATTCTIAGLTNGISYSVSVVGTNSLGTAAAVTAVGIPDGPPETPTAISSTMASKSVTLSWPAVTTTAGVTYKVTASPGGATCITTQTTCTISGLKNGTSYNFEIVTVAPSGKVSPSSVFSARPGFVVLSTSVAKRSKTALLSIVKSASTGKKTWSKSGLCTIVNKKLVAPAKATKCKVILKVAKSAKYPAMSTTVVVAVS